MFRNILRIMLFMLLPFGAMACGSKEKASPLATHEAMFNATATALAAGGTPTWAVPDDVATVRAQLEQVPASTQEALLAGPDAFPVVSKGMGYAGFDDPREIFGGNGGEYGCQDPWLPSPTKCVRWSVHCLLCNGQILCDCPPGGCVVIHTATPKPQDTPVVVTATPKPQDTPVVVTATSKPQDTPVVATPKPEETLKPIPTNGPPGGTATCEPCPSPYGMDVITKKVEELGDPEGYGFWVKEGRGQADACAFEHRENGSGNVFKFTCARGLVCTVDSLSGYFVVVGVGQELVGNRSATIRWLPSYSGEDFCDIFEGEYCNSLADTEWGKLPSPVGASCPTPSPERCRIRNGR